MIRAISVTGISLVLALSCATAYAQNGIIDFESDKWIIRYGQVTEHLGRKSFVGSAYLSDVEFENGTIEVDIAVAGHKVRAYPGIIFRMHSEDNDERFYVRTHRANLY